MGHNAAIRLLGQGSQMASGEVVREETVQMLKRVSVVAAICLTLILLLSNKDSLLHIIDHPVSSVQVSGAFTYLQESEVTETLSGLVGSGFIATDLQDVQTRVEALPWVHSATVSRVWPGEIKLVLTEQVALTRWNDGSLLNSSGIVFTPESVGLNLQNLPQLIGGQHFSVAKKAMMLSTLKVINTQLEFYGLAAAKLELKQRNVWNMTLLNGVSVAMGDISLSDKSGEHALAAKLERIGKVFSSQAGLDTQNILRIDARYPNGVAIKWRPEKIK